VLQVNDLQEQLTQSHAACNDMLSLGSLLDRERIDRARLQASLSTAQLDRSVLTLSFHRLLMQARSGVLLSHCLTALVNGLLSAHPS
jgi:hypothetical protein